MQTEQMIHMPVCILRIIHVFRPFHQLSVASYLIRSQLLQYFFPLFTFSLIDTQHFTGINGILYDFAYNCMHKSSSLIYRTMFRWSGRSGCIRSVRFVPQEVGCKLCTALDDVISGFFQELPVARIVIIIPDVGSQPRTCHRVKVPGHVLAGQGRSETEYICGDGGCPSTGSEIRFRGFFTRLYQRTDKVDQWEHTFRQVSGTGRPIIHLYIDVIMVIHSPRTIYIIVPDALQIGRHVSGTRTGNKQIASKLIIKFFQIGVRLSLAIIL